MMEIDIVKASANKPMPSYYDDTDISEADTALNTPTGSLTDAFVKRFSSTSSSSSSYKATKRKPSMTPSNNNSKSSSPELLHKIQALEMEVNQLVENEINLKSQLLMLKQQQQKQGKQSALDRIHKHIDRFLTSNQQQKSDKNANDLMGDELPALFDENDANVDQVEPGVTSMGGTTHYPAVDIPSVLILRLKAMIEHYTKEGAREHGQGEASFCTELLSTLDTWQSYQFSAVLNQQLEQQKEQDRVTRLLEALHKSLLRNKLMQKDMNMLAKQYKSSLKSMLKDQEQQQQHYQRPPAKKKRTSTAAAAVSHDHCEKTRLLLECQIQNLEMALCTCQDERDEYETTLEMVRREMETMLEELEDTRQQRLRYKTQASRLRAGLEAIQKKKRKPSVYHNTDADGNQDEDQDDDQDSEEEEEEDEATEAIRLMYNEAERQAVDLDRECKRQALTLDSIRKELKLTEEKYQAMKTEKNKQTKQVEQSNRNLTRRIEMLELQLTTNSTSDISVSTAKSTAEQRSDNEAHEHELEENQLLYHAKIHALQIALKAAKSDAIVQRTRIYQLERQSMLDPAQYIVRMQDMFKKQLVLSTTEPNVDIHKRLADRIEFEQREWKQRQWMQFQKKFDMDLLRVNREILTLSSRLTEIEMEAEITQSRHKEAMALVRHQINMDFEQKLHKLMALQQKKERDLQDQLEVLNQKNQTLQDESMILYGRNMMMAHKLGKIA